MTWSDSLPVAERSTLPTWGSTLVSPSPSNMSTWSSLEYERVGNTIGAGQFSCLLKQRVKVAPQFSGDGALAGKERIVYQRYAELNGSGRISGIDLVREHRFADFTGIGKLTGNETATNYVRPQFSGRGRLTAIGTEPPIPQRFPDFVGNGRLSFDEPFYMFQIMPLLAQFSNIDSSATGGLYSGLSAWSYSLLAHAADFTGDGILNMLFHDGLWATMSGERYGTAESQSSIGTFAALMFQIYRVAANFSGYGDLRFDILGGIDGLSATAFPGYTLAENESGAGTLGFTITQKYAQAWALAGLGVLSAAVRMYMTGMVGALGGSGALTSGAFAQYARSSALAGVGALSAAAGMYLFNLAVADSGVGTLSATTAMQMLASPSLASAGALTGLLRMYQLAINYAESGSGTLTNTVVPQYLRSYAESGDGALSAAARMFQANTVVTLSGSGALAGNTVTQYVRIYAETGDGALTATTLPIRFSAPALAGVGSLSATAVGKIVEFISVSMSGTGALTASRTFINTPTVTSVSPTSGLPGSAVTVYGTNFVATSGVYFYNAGWATNVNVVNSTTITCNVPAVAGGEADTVGVYTAPFWSNTNTSFYINAPTQYRTVNFTGGGGLSATAIGHVAVTFDAVSTCPSTTNNTTTGSWTHAGGAGSNVAAIMVVQGLGTDFTGHLAATYGGSAMTLLTQLKGNGSNNTMSLAVFVLANAPSGSQTAVLTCNVGSNIHKGHILTYHDVGSISLAATNVGSSIAMNITASSQIMSRLFTAFVSGSASTTNPITAFNDTQRVNYVTDNSLITRDQIAAGDYDGTATITSTANGPKNNDWDAVALNMVPA